MRGGKEIRNDIADPAPNSKLSKAWHVDAVRAKWSGEFAPCLNHFTRHPNSR
jgi:hypothetical protein